MSATFAIELRPLDSLIPYARNSRTHSDAQVGQIAASIVEFGFTNPVLADATGIVAGHGRVLAARRVYDAGKAVRLPNGQDLPKGTVPVIDCTGWSEAQRRAYVIADNQLALNAGWDMELLKVEIADLQAEGFELGLLGFDENFLDGLLAPPETEGLTDPDEAPGIPDEPVAVLGDVWVLGHHRLMCGDSLDLAAVERLMDRVKADVLITDPPYNVAYEGGTKDKLKIKNDAMSDADFRQFLRDAFVAADAVMKPGAVFYIWHADSEGYNFRGACHEAGWKVRQCLIWEKDSLVLGRQDYQWIHEPCLYGWKDGAGHLWAADRKQTTVLKFDRPKRNDVHPTMKPVALIEYQLLNNTKGGDVVLDLFGGSGTTMIAAEKQGRVARLMELDPRYCDVIVTRWQEFTGKVAFLEADGRGFAEVLGERCPGKVIGNRATDDDKPKKKARKAA
jgi:DNA modification methylase